MFASGSSYAVHVLGRYYLLRARAPSEAATSGALSIVRAPLFIAAATTATGFFAFVVTDIRPMRAFGIACGAGVLLCWVTALELCPAVLTIWPRRARPTPELARLGSAMVRLWHWSFRRRGLVLSAALAVALACLWPMSRVSVRMEPRAFFRPGSEPFRAERFLEERFGGSRFVQVQLSGDFNDPTTLRELGRFSDYARSLERVTQVSSILLPLELVNEGMGGPRRLPATRAQAANLYFFLESEPSLRSLITADRRQALMHVRVLGDPDEVVLALEQFVRDRLSRRPRPQSARDLAERLVWMARAAGRPVADPARLEQLIGDLGLPGDTDAEWARQRALIAAATLTDVGAPPLEPALRERVLAAAATGSPDLDRLLAQATPNPEDARLLGGRLSARLDEARRELAIERSLPLVLAAARVPSGDARRAGDIAALLDDRLLAPQLGSAPAPLEARLAGEPLLDRGFSRAVAHNQVRCLVLSVLVVLALLYALFRSVKVAFLCMAPALLTMGAIFGVMGILGIQIDLGTSLVASIATGAGSDFAMHYVWYLSRAGNRPLPLGHGPHADQVSRSVGPVMAVSVLLVALGFGVLALGRSAVMQLFGALAGLSMSLSALLTCLLLPALIRKVLAEEGPV